jgi:HD superfamily phosphohydrolase
LIEQNIIDYIYDYIAVDDEDYRHIQNQFTERELIRLEHIAHLGLVSKTYKLARHNKLEHAYGTYWISKLCLENTRGLVDNKVAFRLAALLHGIGHLPFSYDSEHALVRLCLVHEPTRQWLNQLFDSVVAYANDDVIEIEAEKMKTNPDYARLHSWFAAYKIANSQVKEIGDTLGKKIVGIWLNVGSIENQLLAELDKIDYVLRDMHYAGLGRIELNFIPVLKQFSKGSSNQLQMPAIVDFIESTHDYLCDQVYFLPKREYLAQILDKSIARGVIESNISLDDVTFQVIDPPGFQAN